MANIFNLQDINDDFTDNIDLDDLYEKKREHDLKNLEVFNKILARAHSKIKIASRQNLNIQFTTFIVPEVMIGIPKYDNGMCIAYIIDKLKKNGLNIKYIHPNMLFISWAHWVPSYVRSEIKDKTGKNIDAYGNYTDEVKKNNTKEDDLDNLLLNNNNNNNNKVINEKDKKYNSIKNYNPSGIYKNDIFDKIDKNLN